MLKSGILDLVVSSCKSHEIYIVSTMHCLSIVYPNPNLIYSYMKKEPLISVQPTHFSSSHFFLFLLVYFQQKKSGLRLPLCYVCGCMSTRQRCSDTSGVRKDPSDTPRVYQTVEKEEKNGLLHYIQHGFQLFLFVSSHALLTGVFLSDL